MNYFGQFARRAVARSNPKASRQFTNGVSLGATGAATIITARRTYDKYGYKENHGVDGRSSVSETVLSTETEVAEGMSASYVVVEVEGKGKGSESASVEQSSASVSAAPISEVAVESEAEESDHVVDNEHLQPLAPIARSFQKPQSSTSSSSSYTSTRTSSPMVDINAGVDQDSFDYRSLYSLIGMGDENIDISVAAPNPVDVQVAYEEVEDMGVVAAITGGIISDVPVDIRASILQEQVVQHVMDPDFRSNIRKKMQERREQIAQAQNGGSRPFVDNNTVTAVEAAAETEEHAMMRRRWEDLKQRHCCVICQDVLAAPMLLPCSHSHCYFCLLEMSQRCIPVEDSFSVEVPMKCPTCKKEFTMDKAHFELNLHESISEAVAVFPDDLKEGWQERRAAFMENQLKKEKEQKQRRAVQAAAEERQEEEERAQSELDEWSRICGKIAPYVAIVVIIILGIARGTK